MSAPFLQMRNVAVARGGKTVLWVDAFEASRGSITVLTGENGAGKSTLLLAAAGLLDLERGRIALFGQDFHRGRAPAPKPLRQQMAMVQQEPYLFQTSVEKNLAYGLALRGMAKSARPEAVRRVMEQIGIGGLAGRPATDLSGGERKLVALGRALAVNPQALLLDEVTASLDEEARERVLDRLAALAAAGCSILMATHLEGLAARLGGRAVPMHAGRLVDPA